MSKMTYVQNKNSTRLIDLALKQMFISNHNKIVIHQCPCFVWKCDSFFIKLTKRDWKFVPARERSTEWKCLLMGQWGGAHLAFTLKITTQIKLFGHHFCGDTYADLEMKAA